MLNDFLGQRRELRHAIAGEFSGELPIFLVTSHTVSLHALTRCRVARFERQQLQELVRDSPSAGELIFQTMSSRTAMASRSFGKCLPRVCKFLAPNLTPTVARSGRFSPPTASRTIGVRPNLNLVRRPGSPYRSMALHLKHLPFAASLKRLVSRPRPNMAITTSSSPARRSRGYGRRGL
jgi:hypothetical protein